MIQRVVSIFLLVGVLFGMGKGVSAALYDVSIGTGDVAFSPPELILATPTRIYATITNQGERDVEGVVRFYDNDALIGTKPFSVRANVRPEDAWVPWTPQGYGQHTIRIVVDNDDAFPDAASGNNTVTTQVFIDRDSDRDGVPDQQDDDRDNDTLLNAEEARRGTDPIKRDTDGDGVDDVRDVFPLDARRSAAPPPAPTSTSRTQPTPTPVRRTVTPSAQTRTNIERVTALPLATTSSAVAPYVDPPFEAVTTTQNAHTSSTELVMDVGTTSTDPSAATTTVSIGDGSSSGASRDLSSVLIMLAVISAFAAGGFIWLSRRQNE